MKNSIFNVRLLRVGAFLCLPIVAGVAADTNSASADATASQPAVAASTPKTNPSATPHLPYGVDDVLKLSRAQINEDIILNYVQNSGTIYNLGPKDIVNLKNEGVSDRVINAMLDQRKTAAQASASASQATPPAATAPTAADATMAAEVPTYGQPAPVYEPAPAPEPVPAPSTVYVIPYPEKYAYYGYYGPYGYSYYSPYYYRPSISFGFRHGGHGHYHGGYHHH